MGYLSGNTDGQYYNGNTFGGYQFASLNDIINQFMVVYVGEGKTISKIKKVDVAFHAMRSLQELSFDTLKSIKAQEVTVPATLQMILPQDYVNYTKISWVDSAGIKHLMYPTSKTSNPASILPSNTDGGVDYKITVDLTASSTVVRVTGEKLWLLHGTQVSGTVIDSVAGGPWHIESVNHSGSDTIFELMDTSNTNTFTATTTIKDELTLKKQGDNLYTQYLNGADVTNAGPWTLTDFIIPVASIADLDGLEVGMVINENTDHWPTGTTVVSIDETNIVLSHTPANTEAAADADISFISKEMQDSTTWGNYKSSTPSENQDDYQDDTYWPMDGSRFGLDPQHAQANGSFYIDDMSGKIHFSSNISGKTVILDYISDSLGTDDEMQVHKFAEEAMYKCIAYAILSTKANVQEYIVKRYKKERFAAIRTAKLRLSNIKLEELTQILRGKSKQIKH